MIAVLVPVLGRAHQIPVLAANLKATTSNPYRFVAICSPGDDEATEACRTHADLTLVAPWQPGPADYARKLALGFHETDEPWLFQGATDLVFYEGWDSAALLVAKRTHAEVIGTNDLGNPLVKRGIHSTHTLISREYINYWGGTTDGSGLIFSEAYDHQWSDSEFIEVARLRRKFAFSKRSIVEHLHPHWNKGEMDATYEKAHRATGKDSKLFMLRRKKFVPAVQQEKRHKNRA